MNRNNKKPLQNNFGKFVLFITLKNTLIHTTCNWGRCCLEEHRTENTEVKSDVQNHTAWVQYILVGLVTGFAIQNRTKLAKISKFKLFKEDVGILEHIKNWTCSRAKRMTRKTYSRSPQVNTENTQNINWMCSKFWGHGLKLGKKKKKHHRIIKIWKVGIQCH